MNQIFKSNAFHVPLNILSGLRFRALIFLHYPSNFVIRLHDFTFLWAPNTPEDLGRSRCKCEWRLILGHVQGHVTHVSQYEPCSNLSENKKTIHKWMQKSPALNFKNILVGLISQPEDCEFVSETDRKKNLFICHILPLLDN